MAHAGVSVGVGRNTEKQVLFSFIWPSLLKITVCPTIPTLATLLSLIQNEGKYLHSICPVPSTILNLFELLGLSPNYVDEEMETQKLVKTQVAKP